MKKLLSTAPPEPLTLIVGIQSPLNSIKNIESYFDEFRNLVKSSGRSYAHEMYIKLRHLEPATFLTKGKVQDIANLCHDKNIVEVILSEPLSVAQERNLTELFGCKVVDRTHLILEIFERGATTSEGKKQISLARFTYDKSRLAGKGVLMSQQSGGIGTRGPGETLKEKTTQYLEGIITKLKAELSEINSIRQTQRKQRVKSPVPLFCLIGYTNAGKSTILNALTKSDVIAQNKLFSTLNTTTRELFIDHTKKALISDTVGFIQQLPHHLIEAFKSTLDELTYADLLIQVIDSSDPNMLDHCRIVQSLLNDLNVDRPMLYVFNKIDKIANRELFEESVAQFKPRVMVSAASPNGLEELVEFLRQWQRA